MKSFDEKSQYPFTYGDTNADEVMLSDFVVELMKTEKFRNYVTALFFAIVALGSYAPPSLAIPIEYGEAAAGMAEGVGQNVPPLGNVAGNVQQGAAHAANNAAGGGAGAQIPLIGQGRVGLGQQAGNQFNNFNQPQMPGPGAGPIPVPAWRLPGPPATAAGQYTNTLLLIGSVGWICLNASWGNPIFAYGCVGVVGGMLNELRKRF